MNNQEQQYLQETQPESRSFDSEVIKYLAMLHLNSSAAAANLPASESPVSSVTRRLSKKRTSPSSSSILRKKLLSKRPALSPSPTVHPSAAVETPSPPLQRSLSEPINYTVQTAETPTGAVLNSLAAASTQLFSSLSPENSKKGDSSAKSASRPPLPPPLRRTSSAPVPSDYQLLASTVTPPRNPAAARTIVNSPISDDESPSSKRLKRMKEKMQEMTDWCQLVLNEGDETADPEGEECKEDDEAHNGTEECVWVDQNPGGSLTIHFKCPCGKSYEVLISGNNCYYKLM